MESFLDAAEDIWHNFRVGALRFDDDGNEIDSKAIYEDESEDESEDENEDENEDETDDEDEDETEAETADEFEKFEVENEGDNHDEEQDDNNDDKDNSASNEGLDLSLYLNLGEMVRDPPPLPPRKPLPLRRVIKPMEAAKTGIKTRPILRGRFAARRRRDLKGTYRACRVSRKLRRENTDYGEVQHNANDPENPMLIQTRVVLRSLGQVPAESLATLHQLYRDINSLTSHYFAVSCTIPEEQEPSLDLLQGSVEGSNRMSGSFKQNFLKQQIKWRIETEEDLLQIAKSQNLMNTGDATVDYNLDQLLDDFFETWGMPKESELALLSQLHRVRMSAINGWFIRKEKRVELLKIDYSERWDLEKWYNKSVYSRR